MGAIQIQSLSFLYGCFGVGYWATLLQKAPEVLGIGGYWVQGCTAPDGTRAALSRRVPEGLGTAGYWVMDCTVTDGTSGTRYWMVLGTGLHCRVLGTTGYWVLLVTRYFIPGGTRYWRVLCTGLHC